MALGRIYHRRTAKKGKSMSDKKNTNKYMYQSGGEPLTVAQYNARLGQITNSFTYSLGKRGNAVTAAGQIDFPTGDDNTAVLKSLYNCLASYTVSLKDNVPVLTYDVMRTMIETAINSVNGTAGTLATGVRNVIMGDNTTHINVKLTDVGSDARTARANEKAAKAADAKAKAEQAKVKADQAKADRADKAKQAAAAFIRPPSSLISSGNSSGKNSP